MESQWGSSSGGDVFRCFVRFTPPVYPSTLIGMRAFFRNADSNSTCRWIVYRDPSGSAQGGVNLSFWDPSTFANPSAGGIYNQTYSVFKDLSLNPVAVTSGDVYVGVSQYIGWYGIAIDIAPDNAVAPDRQWIQQFGYWSKLVDNAYYGQFGVTAFFTPFTTGMHDQRDVLFKISPNPAGDDVEIIFTDGLHKLKVAIFNDLGNIVYQEEFNETSSHLKIDKLKSGIYFIRFMSGSQLYNCKLVKL